jgi:hypothetical protein
MYSNVDDTNTGFCDKRQLWHNVGISHWFVWTARKLFGFIELFCPPQLHMDPPSSTVTPSLVNTFVTLRIRHCDSCREWLNGSRLQLRCVFMSADRWH